MGYKPPRRTLSDSVALKDPDRSQVNAATDHASKLHAKTQTSSVPSVAKINEKIKIEMKNENEK